MNNKNMYDFIKKLPKAELHVHIEGTMEPEQYMQFARRNGIEVGYDTVEQARQAYIFSDFKSFIQAYDIVTRVLVYEQDFYELMIAYLKKAAEQGVVYAEIFFDLQTYLPRGIQPATIINGLYRGIAYGEKRFAITASLILCFMRTQTQKDAFSILERLIPFSDKIIGVGLASFESEEDPPLKFKEVFAKVRSYGFHRVAHVESGGPASLWQAIDDLQVERIDHGFNAVNDPRLLQELVRRKVALTICPLSNKALGFCKNLEEHSLKALLDAGVLVTINSDDPAFFGGSIADNYRVAVESMGLSREDIVTCARNSLLGSWVDAETKNKYITLLDEYIRKG